MEILRSLPVDFRLPVLLVQHINEPFGKAFAEWLDGQTHRRVAYARDGDTCHDFLASYVHRQGPERWLQGQACRGKAGPKHGAWEVKSLRPWTRSGA